MKRKHRKTNEVKNGSLTRRNAVKAICTASLVGSSATAVATGSERGSSRTIRIEGSFDSPVNANEMQAARSKLSDEVRTANETVFESVTPEYQEGYEVVEYVARVDRNGRVSEYYGASSKESESDAHQKGRAKIREFENHVPAVQAAPDPNVGPEWNYIQDEQTSVSDHFGELIHNFEWYRVREGDEERNIFRSLIASSDDTIAPYWRDIKATHDWGESELGNESIHDAGPTTTSSGTATVGIGYPPSASFSYSFDVNGDVTQNLTSSGPVADWSYDIPGGGTSWFYPASHVVSDRANCNSKQKVISLDAYTDWGAAYDLSHRWNVSTVTC